MFNQWQRIMHMEGCIERILARNIRWKLYRLRQSVFNGGNAEGRIERELVSDVCDAYFRMRNPRKMGVRRYSFEEYRQALKDAGFALDGGGGVIGAPGLPDIYIFENVDDGNPNRKEEEGGAVMFVGVPPGGLDMIHISVSPITFARHLMSFAASVPEIRARMGEELFRLRKERDVASIELPYLEQRLAETLGTKNIRYRLDRTSGGNVLYVQIVKEIWMEGPLSMANVERVTGMAPYFIMRPDRLKDEMPDFRIVRRHDLSR